MAWSVIAPDGTKSVRQNQPILQGNTTYTTTFMNKDHFWGDGVNEDGYHRYTTMQKVATDPVVPVDMDLTYFARQKTALESPSNQDVQPFTVDQLAPTAQVLQLLGMRVCGLFNNLAVAAPTILYSHNLTSITRNSTGNYTVVFPSVPSVNYIVLANVNSRPIGGVDRMLTIQYESSTKSQTSLTFKCFFGTTTGFTADPAEFGFAIFGG